ncbi:MAG: hypothetical protein HGB31_06595 [Erysipelotrichaceae bacterium]|nr:hypothetical protein [Erysipelotrichaceae bacterium]
MRITKKDIMYLKWLGLFIGIYVFWTFIWIPMSTNLSNKQSELQLLETQYLLAQQTIPTLDTVIATESEAKVMAAEKFDQFFDILSPAQTEAYLIPLLNQHQGKITYFQVADAIVVIPQTTLKLNEQLTYKIKELVDIYNHITMPTDELPLTESQLLKTQITYIIEVSFEDYTELLSTIDQLDVSILLSSSLYDMNDKTAELVFDIYSIEKIKFTE